MCTKGTPAAVRARCSCSHAMAAGGLLVAVLVGWFAWTHLLLLLSMAGLVAAGTFAAVYWLMRFAQPVRPARPAAPVPVKAGVPDYVPAEWTAQPPGASRRHA